MVNGGDYQEEVLGLVKDLKHLLALLFQRETPFLRLHQAKHINQISIHDNFTNTQETELLKHNLQKAIEQFMIGLGFLVNHDYSHNKKLKKKKRKYNLS